MISDNCNVNYDNELNLRLNKRYFPDTGLKPVFDVRPVSTKYSHFQLMEERAAPKEQLLNYKEYNPHQTFTPSDRKGPSEYFFNNIDVESTLRNQFFALTKSDQSQYMPDFNSNLYNTHSLPQYNKVNTPVENIHFNPDRCNLAPNSFHNHTRNNLKNL
jgi:hypothetical protein